jgi:hypothetical protein
MRCTGTVLVLLEPSLDAVRENLLQLLVMFWTDLSHNGNMNRSAIMHFSGVLRIHPTELCFRKPHDYTPFISALLWGGSLVRPTTYIIQPPQGPLA